jgi:hypothetical protein
MGGQAGAGAGAAQGSSMMPQISNAMAKPQQMSMASGGIAGGPPMGQVPSSVSVAGPSSIPQQQIPQVTQDYKGMAGEVGQGMMEMGQAAAAQSENKKLDALARMGPPPQVQPIGPTLPTPGNDVGARLAALLKGGKKTVVPHSNVGSALATRRF